MNILLLDCDGTIRQPITGKWIDSPENQTIIPGAEKAITYYHQKGWLIIGVTNQGGVAAGHKSLEDCIAEQRRTLALYPQMRYIVFCPDYEGRDCYSVERGTALDDGVTDNGLSRYSREDYPTLDSFRKPGAGMIQLILNGCKEEPNCWYIGDRPEDELCAAAAGVKFMWADIWRDRFTLGVGVTDLSERHISREILLKFLGRT